MDGHNQQLRKKPLPSIEWLRENLRYDPKTGELWWILQGRGRALHKQAGYPRKRDGRWAVGGAGSLSTLLRSRAVFALMEGRWPDCVDHINGNKADDRWENLREVTQAENCRNRPKQANNKSGNVGVFWRSRLSKWESYIRVLGTKKYLGIYADFFEAVCARRSAELKYGFHENHGRTQ